MILVTGGAGYIGSHTCVELLQAGLDVTVADNFSNSSPEALARVERLAGRKLQIEVLDLTDAARLGALFARSRFEAVIHFAGLKAVAESVAEPLRYAFNNVVGTVNLLRCMADHQVKRLVFSSSATVYGEPPRLPVTEDMPLRATNPYGRTKLIIEDLCRDVVAADPSFHVALLRYFNPAGAHPSGDLGEDPRGPPNNLMPYVLQVAIGRRPHLMVFGNDYPTPDGTGVRDYIHVVDLARGHRAALERLANLKGCVAINLGTGRGASVLEMVEAQRQVCGRPVPYQFAPRRPGDVATVYADVSRAQALLGWRAERGLREMCEDGWRWQQKNPDGLARAGSLTANSSARK